MNWRNDLAAFLTGMIVGLVPALVTALIRWLEG